VLGSAINNIADKIVLKQRLAGRLWLIWTQMSGCMNILRVYTSNQNRKKVEMAAKSILGGLI